jgi:hypothetical protein
VITETCIHCGQDLVAHHHRNLRCPNGRKSVYVRSPHPAVYWNPYNKVVQDHRDGTIHREATDLEREARGLPIPWKPEYGDVECRQPEVK